MGKALSSHVRVGEDKVWVRYHCCCCMWREGGRGGYENPCCRCRYENLCCGYGYECRSARPYLYLYLCDTCHMTCLGYPYLWYILCTLNTLHLHSFHKYLECLEPKLLLLVFLPIYQSLSLANQE